MARVDLKNFDAFIPKFHCDVEIVNLNGSVQYLHNKKNNRYLKVTDSECGIINDIFKKTPLVEIVEKEMLKRSQTGLSDVLRLISKLIEAEFLEADKAFSCSGGECGSSKPGKNGAHLLHGISMLRGFNVTEFSSKPVVSAISEVPLFFLSNLFILLLGAISLAGFAGAGTFLNDFRFSYGLQGFSSVAAYGLVVILAWIFVNAVLSLKNLITVVQLSALGIGVKSHGIRFSYGFLFYWIDINPAIKANFKGLTKIFSTRIFIPLAISGALFFAYELFFQFELLLSLSCAAFAVFLFDISPIFKSDINMLLYFTTKSEGDFDISNFFNAKVLVRPMFRWKGELLRKKRFALYTLFASVWAVAVGSFLISVLTIKVSFLLQEITVSHSLYDKFSIGIVLLIALTPIILFFLIMLALIVMNVRSRISKPFAAVMNKLSHQFRDKDMPSIDDFRLFISHVPIMSQISKSEAEMLYSRVKVKRYSQGQNIIMQGEKGDFFYVVYYGKVEVCIESSQGDFVRSDILQAGDVFGEIALNINVPRIATVRALSPTMTFVLDKNSFDEYIIKKLEDEIDVTQVIRVSKMLLNDTVFSHLPANQIFELCRVMTKKVYREGETIFSQDEPGNYMFVVYDGEVEIERKEKGKTVLKKRLKKGDLFGEIAVLRKSPRTATALASSDCCLYVIEKDDLFCLINSSIAFAIKIDALAHERLCEFNVAYL